jgi:hypothetical protein
MSLTVNTHSCVRQLFSIISRDQNSSCLGKTKHLVVDTKLLKFLQVLHCVSQLFLEGKLLQKEKKNAKNVVNLFIFVEFLEDF